MSGLPCLFGICCLPNTSRGRSVHDVPADPGFDGLGTDWNLQPAALLRNRTKNGGEMGVFDVAAALMVLAALLGYVNFRFLRLPHTVGLTVMGAAASLAFVAADEFLTGPDLGAAFRQFVLGVDFSSALLEGMLSFLLFAGALHVDLGCLIQRRWTVAVLATVGVLISTALVGAGFHLIAGLLGFPMPFLWALLFGALISPTDPVAVMGILKSVGVPPALEAEVAGESLFNDGVGIVLVSILTSAALGSGDLSAGGAFELFTVEALGGAALGLILGWVAFLAIRSIDEHNLEVMLTLALVMGGYALAQHLHVSGPIAMAVAGLLMGNHGTRLGMSESSRRHVEGFWSLLDEILNSVLFLLIGLEVVAIATDAGHLLLGLAAIPLVLAVRAVSVAVPIAALGELRRGPFAILVWGGLRGGISIALALGLPEGPERTTILAATYIVVAFSVIVQGITVGKAARRLLKAH
jgi:monovalent cation:H+ antiporter, CPA1 family